MDHGNINDLVHRTLGRVDAIPMIPCAEPNTPPERGSSHNECSLFQDGFPLTTNTFSYICVFWSTDAWSSELSFSFSAFKKWTIKRERVRITCYRWQPAWLVLYFNLYNFTVKASSQDCTSSSVILSAISWMLTAVLSVLKNLKGKND